jgi:hypothetical protein
MEMLEGLAVDAEAVVLGGWAVCFCRAWKRGGSRWWSIWRDCGRVLRYAQDDRFRGRWHLVRARRIEAGLNCAEMGEHRLWRWLAAAVDYSGDEAGEGGAVD